MSILLVTILESFLGDIRKHNEDTGQVAFDCPVCSAEKNLTGGDGKGNLEINYNRNMFKCWSCSDTNYMHGPVIKLLKKHATPKNLRDYLLVKPDANIAIGKDREEIIVTLPEGYLKLSECTGKEYKYSMAIKYLKDRGITSKIIEDYKIGFTTKGDFFNRIIIPSYDSENKLNYFIARWFVPEYTKLKYINPTAEKQEIIFSENKINWDSTIYIVEGVFDHIVIPNSVPLLGKFIPDKFLELLHDYAQGLIVIVLDGDAYEDAKNLYWKLNFGNLLGRIRIVKPPDDYDPSKIFERLGCKGIVKFLSGAYKLNQSDRY
jgi:hypothetical protein|tara:strand:- start:39575 stop:40531 length:957 start_codon:yes stop_codon:yes gene_type:complete